jgi:drug/metabolite transporter (DMT)-like permease
MSGVALAAAAGLGFGVFQTLNVRAVRGLDPFTSTFLQVAVAAAILAAASLLGQDVGRLRDAPAWALADFAAAGLLHFLAGWTFLNLSQRRIGAARTSPLLTTTPLFGLVVAAVSVGQLPGPIGLCAVVLMVAGATVVSLSRRGRGGAASPRDSVFGLMCALCWALSPVLTVRGLRGLDSPALGLTIGLLVSTVAYLLAFAAWRGSLGLRGARGSTLGIKLAAGVLVGLSTWGRWAALDDATIGVVLALNLLSVPVVLVGAPLVAGGHLEQVTAAVWLGAGLVVGGSLVLIAAGGGR